MHNFYFRHIRTDNVYIINSSDELFSQIVLEILQSMTQCFLS